MNKMDLEKSKEEAFSSHLVMVRPYKFYCNQETIADNIYQSKVSQSEELINKKAIEQFDMLVEKLRQNYIKVTVVQDNGKNKTPDSIYPNNWVSFHHKNQAILFAMYAPNRRKQREIPLIDKLQQQLNTKVNILHDYTHFQKESIFLEGTGSMVLDRQNKIAYAALSQRTHHTLLSKFCHDMGFTECSFHASQYSQQKDQKVPIYHTNVLMSVSKKFVMIVLDLIDGQEEKQKVKQMILNHSNKQIIELSGDQIKNFAGNTLTVVNSKGQHLIIMSSTAYNSLKQEQIEEIEKWVKIIHSDLQTIEINGGGSARCMLAEVF